MMNHIDISSVLRQTLACDLYSNLVTRPTGAAVRGQIELLLGETEECGLTVIDFSQVSMIDFSCADEVVAKLLLRFEGGAPQDAYFLLRGVREDHLDAIEAALERYQLALVMQADDGALLLVGTVDDAQRRAWHTLHELGRCAPEELASALGQELADTAAVLASLHERRLVMRFDDTYVPLGATQ